MAGAVPVARGQGAGPRRNPRAGGGRRNDLPETTGELSTDRRARRAAARDRDEPLAAAYESGRSGGDRPEDPELAGYYDDGAKMGRKERRLGRYDDAKSKAGDAAGRAGGRALSVGDDGGGFLLGLFAYALGMNFLRGGAAGSKAWLAAKFLNKTSGGSAPTPNRPSSPTRPTSSTPLTPTTPRPRTRTS